MSKKAPCTCDRAEKRCACCRADGADEHPVVIEDGVTYRACCCPEKA